MDETIFENLEVCVIHAIFILLFFHGHFIIIIIIKYKEKGIMPVSPAHYNDQILH